MTSDQHALIVGADHRGRGPALALASRLKKEGFDPELVVPEDGETTDYPTQACAVAKRVAAEPRLRAVLICGTGVGMAIAANKVKGVRAAVVHDELTAELSKSHLDANVICLSGDLLGQRLIEKVVMLWLNTEFAGGRHERRVNKIRSIEECGEAE